MSLFLTILNYFRQILVALNYFVQSDWRTMVQNLELPYNVQLKAQVVTGIYYMYNFVPNNFKECDLDLKIA
jgi:hypothetical protein